jgi:hypothetical protein
VRGIRQHPELLRNVRPIEGLIAHEEFEFAARDWHGACDAFHRHAANRSKEVQRVMRVHRDPFEPIMCTLEADKPLAEYHKITDEILKRMPDEDLYPRPAAEAVRAGATESKDGKCSSRRSPSRIRARPSLGRSHSG